MLHKAALLRFDTDTEAWIPYSQIEDNGEVFKCHTVFD